MITNISTGILDIDISINPIIGIINILVKRYIPIKIQFLNKYRIHFKNALKFYLSHTIRI